VLLLSTAAHRAEPAAAAAAPISYFWKVIPSLEQTLLLLFIKRLGGRDARRMSKETYKTRREYNEEEEEKTISADQSVWLCASITN
jgi:hypothetical protein